MNGMAQPLRCAGVIVLGVALHACGSHYDASDHVAAASEPIIGGQTATTCQWPTAVLTARGCSATLVHPRLVTTAAHCVLLSYVGATVTFGESMNGRSVQVDQCHYHPSYRQDGDPNDIGFCTLLQDVVDVPIVPILMGCDVGILTQGRPVTLAGFGITAPGGTTGYGTKRWVDVNIDSVQGGDVYLGNTQVGACHGDSGGPAYVKIADGTWRVFGATSRPGGQPECAAPTIYTLISQYVPWIEQASGIDITPCTDANGNWGPGPGCTGFPLNPEHGGGTWGAGCADMTLRSGPSMTCGPSIGGVDAGAADAGIDGSVGATDGAAAGDAGGNAGGSEGGARGADGAGGGAQADANDDTGFGARQESAGCGCLAVAASPASSEGAVLVLAALLTLRRRRRAATVGRGRWVGDDDEERR